MDGLFSDEELFLTQNSFSEERVEDNFSIDSILYGLVACDEPLDFTPLKREVELEEESTRKFSKSCDEARIPETKAMTFNQCTFIISKD
ncbi:hypothetical protein pdam_00002093 [Pocillopora damicornis]|uniref:Uncharacterized protein n=1 Tax=Pocillopora damicornis TaxID=46731 RepID=A0A3M6U1R4_POCDA|nr:hypothetical protein pdam_00002093 [Pocillopora damicornis]